MKRYFTLLFLIISPILTARQYFVSPSGIDGAYPTRGTQANPWKSWHYAFNNVTPGDTVYFRGGIYTTMYSNFVGAQIATSSVSGSRENPTRFLAYPDDFDKGNYPVLDCQSLSFTVGPNVGVRISRAHNLHFKGLFIKNIRQTYPYVYGAGQGWYLWAENHSTHEYRPNNITFENCVAHNIAGDGFKTHSVDTAYYYNCDAYNNMDSLTLDADVGGQGTGFNVGVRPDLSDSSDYSYIYLYGCRAWTNSDQGYATGTRSRVVFDNCWAINNGNNPHEDRVAENAGSGIKLWFQTLIPGISKRNKLNMTQIVIRNCVLAYNAYVGLNWTHYGSTPDPDHPEIRAHIYNNFIYGNIYYVYNWDNVWGYGIGDGANKDTIGQWDHRYWNNVSYYNVERGDDLSGVFEPDKTAAYNKFDINPTTVQSNWFLSLDTTGMMGIHEREKDWSLPATNFGKPSSTSPLIDAGIDLSSISSMEGIEPLDYQGVAPDIGWSEAPGEPATPLYVNSTIENATPSLLTITYNLTLANIIPEASVFSVTVNSTRRSVNTVSISGNRVILTISSPVVNGDVVTVAYTKPATNQLQSLSGVQAATLSPQPVVNNVASPIPVYISSVIENASPSILELTYNLTLAPIVPAASSFSVMVNSTSRTINSITISDTRVLLTLSSPVVYGDIVTVSYTKSAINPLQSLAGMQVETMPARAVLNSVSNIINQPPVVIISSPTKSESFIAPANIVIDATASDQDGSITKVEFFSGTVKLGEKTSFPYSFTWKEVPEGSYIVTARATDNKNAISTSPQVTVVVEKSSTAVNQIPVININKPIKNKKYKNHENILIEASATDLDGTISKVEFKSGEILLGEDRSVPYEYILQNPDTGTYNITVIATDNLGAISLPSEIQFTVELPAAEDADYIILYPNPNNGIFKLDYISQLPETDNRLLIVRVSGEIVYEEDLDTADLTREHDLSGIAPGNYILMIKNNQGIITSKKFIKY